MRVGFVGRFQPFHKGHKKAVETLQEEHEVVMVLGIAEERDRENPLNFEERKNIIRSCFPEIEIFGIEDRESDKDWASELEQKTGIDAVATRNPKTNNAVKENNSLEIIEHEFHRKNVYSGTEVRRRLRSGEEWRYLVPKCAEKAIEKIIDKVKGSGIDYEFKPGWKRENSYYDTLDS